MTRVITLLVEDDKQDPELRVALFFSIERLPNADLKRLRALCTRLLNDRSSHLWLRLSAARTLGTKRVATNATRALLEKTLFAEGDDHAVQGVCLAALVPTAPLDHLRDLLLSDRLREHKAYMVRVRVCCGLATFGVRTRDTLEYLCRQIGDVDPRDTGTWLPREAILSFWALTGRAPGIAAEHEALFSHVPDSPPSEVDLRDQLAVWMFVGQGVSKSMREAVKDVTCKNIESVRAAQVKGEGIPWVRNDEGTRAAAEAARKQLDAIEAEWRAQDSRGGR